MKKFLCLFPIGDIHRYTEDPRGISCAIADTSRSSPDPPHRSIRQHDAILSFIAALSPYRLLHYLIARRSIVRMHTLLEFTITDFTMRRELKELTNFVGEPQFFCGRIKFPDSKLRGIGRKRDAFLELMQALFAVSATR